MLDPLNKVQHNYIKMESPPLTSILVLRVCDIRTFTQAMQNLWLIIYSPVVLVCNDKT